MSDLSSIDLESIGRWCNQKNLRFHRDDDRIRIPDVGRNQLHMAFTLDRERQVLVVVAALPAQVKVGPTVLAAAANRVNQGVRLGAMVVPSKGDAYFRASVPTKGFGAEPDGIGYLFDLVLGTANEVLPRYRRVAAGEIPPDALFD